MKVLVTGSSGHLGEGLVRSLLDLQHEVIGLDIVESPFTNHVGSIADRSWVRRCMRGVQAVFHAATLHKPHVATRSRQEFVDMNIGGTPNLLEEAVTACVESFVYTSTTSAFGDALVPPLGAPAAWITERLRLYLRTSMARPRRQLRISANCSIGTKVLHVSCSGHPDFSLRKMTIGECGKPTQTPM
jgi:nucleoside-diphosphate-sugar epimerase